MKKLLILGLSMAMVGCGGGGGSDSPKTQDKPTTSTESGSTGNTFNGLFQAEEAVLLVDLDHAEKIIAINSDGTLFNFDSAYTFANELRLTGARITFVDGTEEYYKDQVVSVHFDGSTANAMTTINGQKFTHSFTRQADIPALSAFEGTHTNPDNGSTWAIDAAGNIEVNGACSISAKPSESRGYYHKVTATAVSCLDPDFNGSYEGFVFSVNYKGQKVLGGMVYNNSGLSMWDYVPLSL